MEKMLVVVLNDEKKAYEASQSLKRLDSDGSIAIHAESVIAKNANGTVEMKQENDDFPIRTAGGTAIGSLIGLLGGPVGLGVGALTGAAAGSFSDLFVAGVDSDFLGEVSTRLTPGRCAVVADISEEWVTPIDTEMEALDGQVFRTTRKSFEDDQRARDIAESKAEIEQLKAEHARAKAERKAKLQAKIDQLNNKLQQKLEQRKQRAAQIRSETDAKVQALQKKAAKSKADVKAVMDERVKQIKKQFETSLAA